jgi:hypothetical protein
MPLLDDATIPPEAVLFRVLYKNWTTTDKVGRRRPSSIAFFSTEQEISYFIDGPGILAELRRLFPGNEIARVPVSVLRGEGFAIERRPTECGEDFRCDRNSHVVAGPTTEIRRNDYQKRAGRIAKHLDVSILHPETSAATTNAAKI